MRIGGAAPSNRLIGGIMFIYESTWTTKEEAEEAAKKLRKRGFIVKVIDWKSREWMVYFRKK